MSSKKKTILIIGTADTKGEEIAYMKNIIESRHPVSESEIILN